MDVAVTGAVGHVGANLVRALLAQGRTVRVLVHSDKRGVDGLPVEVVEGSVLDPESLRRFCTGVEVVYHCAAHISIVGAEGGAVERTNVQGPTNMVQACLDAGVRRLVHFSSIHAFNSDPVDQVIDETRALATDAPAAYDRSKANGQLAVLAGVKRGLDAVIVNPCAVLGPYDFRVSRMGEVLLDLYHDRLPSLVDGGYNWVDARDVVAGALAAEKKGRTGEVYLLAGHWVHIRDLAALVTELTGRKTPRLALPLPLVWPAALATLWWARLNKKVPKFTPLALRALHMHRLISHAKATAELGYEPRPLQDTVRDTLAWFEQVGWLAKHPKA
jgi:dihydroflavonol-4-reductase